MQLAKPAGRKPRDIAEALIAALPASESVREVNIAGPGFINFFASEASNILALSVWLRYLSTGAVADFPFPSNGYRGDYINDIAATLRAKVGNDLERDPVALFDGVVDDEAVGSDGAATGDKEAHVDALIERAQTELGDKAWCIVFDHGLEAILADIRTDLGEFGVHYDEWFSERSIASDVEQVVERLAVAGHLYEKDGSRWFRSTAFGS